MRSKQKLIQSSATLFALCALPTALSADNCCPKKPRSCVVCPEIVSTTSARGCCDVSQGVYFTGDFIYWQVLEDQIAICEKLTTVGTTTTNKMEKPHFRWDPGFKVGVGYNTPFDGWDVYAQWTWLHSHKTTKVNTVGPNLLNFFNGAADHMSGKFEFHYNTLDLELGRRLYLSRKLSMRPMVGLRGASINQKFHVRTSTLSVPSGGNNNKYKNDFFAGGPRIGLSTRWGSKWAVFGDLDFAVLYGKFKVRTTSVAQDLSATDIFEDNKHRLRPNLQLLLGGEWGTCIEDQYYVNFKAAYEVQYWWGQWQARNLQNTFPNGDLMTHGLTFQGRFEF